MESNTALKPFLDDNGRLTLFPAKRAKKLLALAYLAKKFELDRIYTEKEVGELLNQWHTFGDPATLRRELYDAHLLNRDAHGQRYWLEPAKSE